MSSNLIPIFIEKYLTNTMTFIYRQIVADSDVGKKVILTSSTTKNLNIFPFPQIYCKSKNLFELLILKFYEKVLRDRFFNDYYRVLSYSQSKYFYNFLDNPNIQFVHAHFGTAALEIFKIAEKLKKKLLISFHGVDASKLLNSKSYKNNLKMFFHKSYIIVPSNFMKERLESEIGKPKKSFVIHYGIPINFFELINRKTIISKIAENEKITFLQVSSFREKKGHIYTLKAFSKLRLRFKNIELLLGGDGPLLDKMRKEVKDLGMLQAVKFLGKVNQGAVKELFKVADVFLHHSITAKNGDQEGIPNVIMEAMASGLPVISTFHAGISELINEGQNGYLVKEKDVDGYVEKMQFVLFNSQLEVSKNARKTIEKEFNLELQLKKLNNIYEYLLKDKKEDLK